MTSANITAMPLSRPTPVDDVGEGLRLRVVADAAECAALARLNALVEVRRLEADMLVRQEGREGLRVTGELRAEVVQSSVVSLEPVEAEVREAIDVHFLGGRALEAFMKARAKRAEETPDLVEEEEIPDPIVDGSIDLGGLAAEYLTLGLDPYPKRPGEVFVEPAPPEASPEESPFAALKALRPDAT